MYIGFWSIFFRRRNIDETKIDAQNDWQSFSDLLHCFPVLFARKRMRKNARKSLQSTDSMRKCVGNVQLWILSRKTMLYIELNEFATSKPYSSVDAVLLSTIVCFFCSFNFMLVLCFFPSLFWWKTIASNSLYWWMNDKTDCIYLGMKLLHESGPNVFMWIQFLLTSVGYVCLIFLGWISTMPMSAN